jgi:hypothetical protein
MGSEVIVPVANLPAHLQAVVGSSEAAKEYTEGVQTGFPIISYRGKTWRVRQSGEEQVYLDDNNDAVQTIEVVLVKSNERLSKTYYKGKYTEGDKSKPECWSATGVSPEPDVPNPVNAACQSCPMNVWGSRITEQGNKTRACQDVRRVGVVFQHELEAFEHGEKKLEEVPVMLLRIPPASLNPLKDYVQKVLDPKGLPPFVLSTKIGFDTDASFPKLTFGPGRFLTATEFSAVEGFRESDMVKRILDTSAEHAEAGTTEDGGEAASSASTANAETPKSAPAEASPNTEEQHFSEAVELAPAPAPAPAAAPAPAPAPAAAPAPAVAPAPVATAPTEVVADTIAAAPQRAAAVEEEAAAETIEQPPAPKAEKPKAAKSEVAPAPIQSPSGDGDIDDMLASILD